MMMSHLPNIDKDFSLVIQQERELNFSSSTNVPNTSGEEVVAFQVRTASGNQAGKSGNNAYKGKVRGYGGAKGHNRVCTHCGRTNHTIETCFLKHGYAPGFKQIGKLPTTIVSANATLDSPQFTSTSFGFGFTQDQYNSLLELLQQSKTSPKANSISTSPFVLNSHSSNSNGKNPFLWILNTGATDHICFNIASFISHKNIILVHVSLPNGSQITATIFGSVELSSYLILHNVLYIPSFHVNLISIAKLKKLPFPNSVTQSTASFQILHADIWGPFFTISILGHKYILTLVDDYSRSDNGSEFLALSNFFLSSPSM
ncbi:uncharacterized protein LOC131657927 [Vicia villosa]|uniref:uncharacterized protein LOC131657927 n=1 Tax=Vicia villosa TaxID=3911 RepID=UPI00273B9DCE|nr:uncharacterized protein LOC131657927 [Vicia villosa]